MNTLEQINFTRPILLESIRYYQENKRTLGTFSVPLEIEWDSVNQLAKSEFPDWYIELTDDVTCNFWSFFYNPHGN
jgi:hypothetical protein